ncbi:MAG: P1 family peptidase [Pseudomonadota bacterium]
MLNTIRRKTKLRSSIIALSLSVSAAFGAAQAEDGVRARDLGVPFKGETGPLNAITDVAGVEVGHSTIIRGSGKMVRGKGPVRTGVTAVHPRGKDSTSPVFGAWFTLNASGEMTGTTWLEERGLIDGPIMITNTHSVGVVRDAAVEWMVDQGWPAMWHAPVVAETYDGALNDINGFHVKKKHAMEALKTARSGPVEEGVVGGGTGMTCNQFKGGIGTSSRRVDVDGEVYTVGVLVQCNYGQRHHLKQIASVSVEALNEVPKPCFLDPSLKKYSPVYWKDGCEDAASARQEEKELDGSIIIIVATDAHLLPNQLKRLVKRASLGMGWLGAVSSDGSGDIFVAFSTAHNDKLSEEETSSDLTMYPNNRLTPLFEATAQATEEAIVNAMVAAETTTGANTYTVYELPEDKLREIMSAHTAK